RESNGVGKSAGDNARAIPRSNSPNAIDFVGTGRQPRAVAAESGRRTIGLGKKVVNLLPGVDIPKSDADPLPLTRGYPFAIRADCDARHVRLIAQSLRLSIFSELNDMRLLVENQCNRFTCAIDASAVGSS